MDEEQGIVVTTVGCQFTPPGCVYPPSWHPEKYNFKPQTGRILNEYQLVYIVKGGGYLSSQSCKPQKINTGTMILLFPGERYGYYPGRETGQDEYRVGFRGIHIDRRAEKKFFTREEPLHRIGLSATIIGPYEDMLKFTSEEKSGYRQMISSIVLHILDSVYYKEKNNSFVNICVVDKINKACISTKENIRGPLSPEETTARLGLGYSQFRQMLKEYTGVSLTQCQLQQKPFRVKELLTSTPLTISEVAYSLYFENAGQFPTFLKKKEEATSSGFRDRTHRAGMNHLIRFIRHMHDIPCFW